MRNSEVKTARKNPGQIPAEPIFYEDRRGWRIVDLRTHGVDCIPLLAFRNFRAVRPGASFHVHPDHVEVCLCLRGRLQYETADSLCTLLPGWVFMSCPNEPHRRCENPKGAMFYRLLFAIPQKGGQILGLTAKESAQIVRALLHRPQRTFCATDRLRAAFARLFALCDSQNGVLHRLEMKNAALELLLALAEAASESFSAKDRSSSKIRDIVKRIVENPEYDYPVAALAAEAALSPSAFTESFKCETGYTPHAYLVDCRVRRAYDDLARNGLRIAAVAGKWRFPSPQHFATVFKRVLGITPSQALAGVRK